MTWALGMRDDRVDRGLNSWFLWRARMEGPYSWVLVRVEL